MHRIGIIGFGWLGKPAGIRLRIMNDEVSCITSSPNRISDIESVGISATHIDLNADYSAELFDWLENKDVVLFAIPPSKLDNYVGVVENIAAMLTENQKMVFISSTSVYSDDQLVVDETSPLSPSKRSGTTLIDAEHVLYKKLGKRVTIIRMGGLVGDDRQPALYFAGKKDVKGGNEATNFIHREDAVHLIFHVIIYEIYGEIINGVCGGHTPRKIYYPFVLDLMKKETVAFDPTDKNKGKVVSNYKSLQLGMWYKYDNPMRFPEIVQLMKEKQ